MSSISSSTSRRARIRRNSHELLRYAKRLQEKYILHPFWSDSTMGKIHELSQVPDVDIAEAGCCKYILVEIRDGGTTYNQSKLVVRGDASSADHGDVLDAMRDEIDETKLTLDCKGGGRIEIDPGTRNISVYGYSPEFGAADHEKTVEILKKQFPEWTVEINDDEY